ncbi:hypothetical protein JCM6882_001287 [Rhodosporidiobolus microsporus]
MQSSTSFDQAADLPAFSFGLDTPSKFLNSTSPTPWSLGGGLTPSLFSSLNSRDFTPSFSGANGGEANPFELSLSGNKRNSIAGPSGSRADDGDFDLFASLGGGRKRALSSPAIRTPGGSDFPFLSQGAMAPPSQSAADLVDFAFKPSAKRPRMDSMASSSNESVEKMFSDSDKRNDSEASPASSAVLTPPDANVPLPSIKEDAPLTSHDIAVSAPPSFISQPLADSSTLAYSQPPAPASLLAQLAQERSALVAAGNSNFSQSAPLPMKRLDVAIKPEPVDEQLPPSPVAPRPPVTRGQSKKGKAPESSTSASTSQETTASPAPGPKRKGGRKKAAAAKAAKAPEGEEAEEDEESTKRRQFLERNRVAACKSRQKKKERVGQLEQLAADLCSRNQNLQQTALALRNEVLGLRQMMLQHNGCNCEHAQGYIVRDANGGGIATIDQLAGTTLTLDYSVPPSMGTDDDVYSFLDRNEPGPPAINQIDPVGGMPIGGSGRPYPHPSMSGSAIPLVPASPVRGAAMMQPHAPQEMIPGSGSGIRTRSSTHGGGGRPLNGASIPTTSLAPSSFAATMMDPSVAQGMLDIPVARRSSAPPTTPSWEAPQPAGDYFAPKEHVVCA